LPAYGRGSISERRAFVIAFALSMAILALATLLIYVPRRRRLRRRSS
jgi:hypothetical protein